MIADKIFYADAHHHVIVTDSAFIVKNKEYRIPGIRNHDLKMIRPFRVPGLIFVMAGTFLVLSGTFHVVSFWFIPDVTVFSWTIGAYGWAIIAGSLLLLAGLVMNIMMKPRYALHISTDEGENDVIVSPKREYVKQIIDALNRAFMLMKK